MIGQKIAVARKKKGLSQKDFAALVPMDPGNLARIEGGQVVPPPKKLLRISDLLGIPMDNLMAQEESETFDEASFNKKWKKVLGLPVGRKKALVVVIDALLDLTRVEDSIKRIKK